MAMLYEEVTETSDEFREELLDTLDELWETIDDVGFEDPERSDYALALLDELVFTILGPAELMEYYSDDAESTTPPDVDDLIAKITRYHAR